MIRVAAHRFPAARQLPIQEPDGRRGFCGQKHPAAQAMVAPHTTQGTPRIRTRIVRKPSYPGAMTNTKAEPGELTIRPLTPETWDAFADLAERHNGVWGGCWCTWFHRAVGEKKLTADGDRALKERLVTEGRAHAALVFHGEIAVGWCEYGRPCEASIHELRREDPRMWTHALHR